MGAIVLFSGGLDSTVCLADAVNRYGNDEVVALTLYYGQKHSKELDSAEEITRYYEVCHVVQDLASVFALSDSALLKRSQKDIPQGTYADNATKDDNGISKTYVPYRNGLFLSYAAAMAYSIGAEVIYYGAHADDSGNAYPDTSPDFVELQDATIQVGTGGLVRVHTPFVHSTKADIVYHGIQLRVPFDLTWSCYEGREKACGKCATCLDRIKAFEANGVKDPIEYEGSAL